MPRSGGRSSNARSSHQGPQRCSYHKSLSHHQVDSREAPRKMGDISYSNSNASELKWSEWKGYRKSCWYDGKKNKKSKITRDQALFLMCIVISIFIFSTIGYIS